MPHLGNYHELCVFQLEPNITPVISTLFASLSERATSNMSCDTKQVHSKCTEADAITSLNLNKIGLADSERDDSLSYEEIQESSSGIWPLVCNVETTPALKLAWKRTSLNAKLFKFLNVNPENVSPFEIDLP